MSTVKLSLAKMTFPEKLQFSHRVCNAITAADPLFPDPPWAVPDLEDFISDVELRYETALRIRTQAKTLTTYFDQGEAELDQALTQMATYVQSISGGSAEIIGKAGMDVKASPSPVGPLPAPTGLSAIASAMEGEVALRWTSVKGAKSYQIQSATDLSGTGNWQSASSSTKGRCTVKGLTSGEKYWFRVAAVGAAGQGAWSDAVGRIAP